MIKKIFILFKLARKLALSDVLTIADKFHKSPTIVKIFFKIFSFSITKKKEINFNITEEERLSNSLQSMGTTFIKLGQFLATRPDIIGENLSRQLETLQDKLPPFSQLEAKKLDENCDKNIVTNSRRILQNAIRKGGSTIRDFKNTRGNQGNFQKEFNVYGRDKQNCKRFTCSGTINKITQSNRSTFLCEICQK